MKATTIKKILAKKFAAFCDSITNPEIKELVRQGTIISGGSIVNMLMNENVNDYDLYFKDFSTAYRVSEYYARKFEETHPNYKITVRGNGDRILIGVNSSKNESVAGEIDDPTEPQDVEEVDLASVKVESENVPKYSPIFLSDNAITLSTKVQLIIRFFGPPEEIHRNFDFVHCTCYWTSWDNDLVLPQAALEAILNKELRYVGSLYPICSVIRTRKFLRRGWQINAGQYLKMCWQISNLDLTSLSVLRDQLVGVDSAYFAMLIRDLEDTHETGAPLESTRVIKAIEKIFG